MMDHPPPSANGQQPVASSRRPASALAVLLATGLALSLTACGPKNFVNENDRLRRSNMELQSEIETLREKLERQSNQVQAMQQRLSDSDAADTQPGVVEPMLTRIKLGRYSGPIDTDGDGVDDTLRLYLSTLDQDGRLLPVVAQAKIQVVNIPSEAEPRKLASKTYSPAEFNQAYRSSFTGRHYTLEAELPRPLPEGLKDLTVKVTLTHSRSGSTFTAQQTYALTRQ